MRKNFISPEVYLARLSAMEALLQFPAAEVPDFNSVAGELDSTSASLSSSSSAVAYAAFAGIVRIAGTLAQWHSAIMDALPDGDRFLRSAKARYQLWLKEYESQGAAAKLVRASAAIANMANPEEAVQLIRAIGSVPLPMGILKQERPFGRGYSTQLEDSPQLEPLQLTVAFLKFQIDSVDVQDIHQLSPGEVHDLELEIRVSRWPDEHSELRLTPRRYTQFLALARSRNFPIVFAAT